MIVGIMTVAAINHLLTWIFPSIIRKKEENESADCADFRGLKKKKDLSEPQMNADERGFRFPGLNKNWPKKFGSAPHLFHRQSF